MIIGGAAIASVPIAGLADTATIGDATLLFQQNVIANVGHAALFFQQTVTEIGNAQLLFEQTVSHPVGAAMLLFTQSVGDVGDATLLFSQNVFDPVIVADSWVDWDATVIVDGIDIGNDLVGDMTVDAEKSAARIADFTIALSGVVDITSWTGREVEINYIQNTGATWRRFSGVIEHADYDIDTKTLRCTCTDDYQRIVDGYTNQQLFDLTGGFYSNHIFNEDNKGVDLLNDLLSTVSKSVELNSNRQLIVSSLQNKAVADYTFDESLILNDSLSVKIAPRNQLINNVEIEFNSRFNRLYHINKLYSWQYSRLFCQNFYFPVDFPSQQDIVDAIENGGWALNSIAYTPIWPTGLYFCGEFDVVSFANHFPDGIRGFSANCGFRWSQSITDNFKINVGCSDSIDKYGDLQHKLSASANISGETEDWGGADDDFKVLPAGFVKQIGGHYAFDDADANEIDAASKVLVNQSVTIINSSHQQNSVFFGLPLSPFIELDQTIAVSDGEIDAKGIIRRFTETYNFSTSEPITTIELAISSGESNVDVVNQLFTAPTKPALIEDTEQHLNGSVVIGDHIGGLEDSPVENPHWTGIILNASAILSPSVLPTETYTAAIKIEFDAIDDDLVLNKDVELNSSINITVPDNLLTVTA